MIPSEIKIIPIMVAPIRDKIPEMIKNRVITTRSRHKSML
jgi:hypothetical protein